MVKSVKLSQLRGLILIGHLEKPPAAFGPRAILSMLEARVRRVADARAEQQQKRLRTRSARVKRRSGNPHRRTRPVLHSRNLDREALGGYGYAEDCIGYGVELSTKTARKAPSRPRGRRGLDRNAILDAAFDLLSRDGELGFSVRKLGVSIGVDPMTVLHHFGSRDELLRRIADRALATVALPLPSADWRADLRHVAASYRDLAHRHPRVFHLHFRFHATGPADHASSEVVYRALRKAGLADAEAAGLGLAFYAFILGYALAEAEGLLRPIGEDDEAELQDLDPLSLSRHAGADPGVQDARSRGDLSSVGRRLHRRGFVPLQSPHEALIRQRGTRRHSLRTRRRPHRSAAASRAARR